MEVEEKVTEVLWAIEIICIELRVKVQGNSCDIEAILPNFCIWSSILFKSLPKNCL